jgi:DHA1 family bicyclomycin/chloramphenicol resistance-like MFS transporter
MEIKPHKQTLTEYIIMLAFMISIVAMATDVMLPALGVIAKDLAIADPNDSHFVVSTLFLGFAIGQLFVGPLSDSFGRKPVVYISYAIFIFGCVLSLISTSFQVLLIGRVLQGLGVAGPRIVSVAIIRDGYEGRAMARIMSIIMAVFIIVPAVAPAIGQAVTFISGWRATFALLLVMGVISSIWFAARQPETLAIDARRELSLRNVWSGILEISKNRVVVGYTIAAGLIFGPFLGYLSSAQKIFQITYATGNYFALYFGIAAIAIGASSLLNSQLVMRLGMQFLTMCALLGAIVASTLFVVPVLLSDGVPPFWLFMVWLLITFFCVGILFGNLNALAMEPLGEMAGLGAAMVGAVSTFISLPLGWAISVNFFGGVTSLVLGFACCCTTALIFVIGSGRKSTFTETP